MTYTYALKILTFYFYFFVIPQKKVADWQIGESWCLVDTCKCPNIVYALHAILRAYIYSILSLRIYHRCHDLISNASFPRHIVIATADSSKPISNHYRFVIEKTFFSILATLKSVEKLRNETLLVECLSQQKAKQSTFSQNKNQSGCKGLLSQNSFN